MAADDWHRVDPLDVPGDGRVRSVVVDGRTVALARCGLTLGALDNRCPHQGGPLGEGPIENGWLRCPWHGYDYDPIGGKPPEGFSDGVAPYQVEGGLGQYATELKTAVKYGIPIKHVLLDNHAFAKIAKEQRAEDFPVWHTSLVNPGWAGYARLCGATGIRVDRRDQLDAAMAELFAADGPALLHIEQDPELL
jgi:nitrite reductase/ring-hydroxylating ferredoxin subunit